MSDEPHRTEDSSAPRAPGVPSAHSAPGTSARHLVRAATPADVPAVLPMVRAICEQHRAWDAEKFGFLDDIVERYARWLPERATDPRSVFLVAELPAPDASPPTAARPPAPELVGYLVGTIEDAVPIYWIREHAWIHDVWVEPAHRGQGLGRAMVLSAIDAFSCLGVQQMRLETAALNDASRRLFASCGFRVSAVEMLRPLTISPTPRPSPRPHTEPAP